MVNDVYFVCPSQKKLSCAVKKIAKSLTTVLSCYVLHNVPFYLWINIFYLTLSVGLSTHVPPKRKRGIEKNESEQPPGKVHAAMKLVAGEMIMVIISKEFFPLY